MPRRREVPKRKVLPDPKFGSEMLTKFMNMVMEDGKKSVAEKIIYGALEKLSDKAKGEPLPVLEQALDNVKPMVEVRSERRTTLAMRWILDAARKRSESTMAFRLAAELQEASESRGSAVKKREDTHRMAEANKAFSHYRW
jgi:small subunit ribosomal protein S7